jgi:hypothetical protein
MKKVFVLVALLLMMLSCSTSRNNGMMTGNDRDSHGCIGSAGYSWSKVRKDCIQVFEDGIQVKDDKCPEGEATYAVFSKDSNRVEIFACYNQKNEILYRKGDRWNGEKITLIHDSIEWVIESK